MDHVTDFLEPYLDGELRNSQVTKIENHLETCALCRAELAELEQLSLILHSAVPLPSLKSEDQFVTEVGLLLERRPEPSAMKRALITGWKTIPVGLAGTWVVAQTALIVTTVVYGLSLLAPGIGGLQQVLAASEQPVLSNSLSFITKPLLIQIIEVITNLLQIDIPFSLNISIFNFIPYIICTLYVCWLASWWISRDRKSVKQSVPK